MIRRIERDGVHVADEITPDPPPPPNRKDRRASTGPSIREQQLAMLMARVHYEGKLSRREGEPEADYFKRLRVEALRIQRERRASKRRTVKAARKRNR